MGEKKIRDMEKKVPLKGYEWKKVRLRDLARSCEIPQMFQHCVHVLPGYFCFKNKDGDVIKLIFIPPCPSASVGRPLLGPLLS